MDFLKQWILSISFAALSGTLVYFISPKGSTRRVMRTVIAMFLLLAIALPFADLGRVTLSAEQETQNAAHQAADLEDRLARQVYDTTEAALRNTVQTALERREINFGQIVINTDILEDGSIRITEACITQASISEAVLREVEAEVLQQSGLAIALTTQPM